MENILQRIIADKRREMEMKREQAALEDLRAAAMDRPKPPPFAAALRAAPIGLIAEVKRKSPSAGIIRDPFLPAEIAKAYELAGAQAVSVLIDEKYFGGGEAIFSEVRAAISLPMLYKEFVVDEWQIWHAASLGASAVLLIAAAMEPEAVRHLMDIARTAGLEVLFEVHNSAEMAVARQLEAKLTGINNRDLKTFEVSLETTLKLKNEAPAGATLVSESGIKSRQNVRILKESGIQGILVGQQLLEHGKDPAAEIAGLMA